MSKISLDEKRACPFCNSEDINLLGAMSTLVGWFGGKDPNHHYCDYKCNSCEKKFSYDYVIADDNAWYYETKDDISYVLRGEPSCCETNYLKKCECGGWIKHSRHNKIQSYEYINGHHFPKYPEFYQCDSCNKKFLDEKYGNSFMDEASIEAFAKFATENPKLSKPMPNIIFSEQPGEIIINPNALNKLKL